MGKFLKTVLAGIFCCSAACFAGTGELREFDDISVIGKGEYNETFKRVFHTGEQVKIDGHILPLTLEADEMYTRGFGADLNQDGKKDYVVVLQGTGNGINMGLCDVFVFVSCPPGAEPGISSGHIVDGGKGVRFRFTCMASYGVNAVKAGSRILLETTTLSEDRKTAIVHYFSFDRDAWMRQELVRLKR
jgi:hypothetical protein